jgi:nucleotide-binding universal stress UspA family protein
MQKILLAYDGGDASQRALGTAAELAKALGASVSVVSVVPTHGGRLGMDPWDDSEVHAKELVEARTLLRERGIEAQLLEPIGEPAATIERIAREGEYDTIVIGSRPTPWSESSRGASPSTSPPRRRTVVIAR